MMRSKRRSPRRRSLMRNERTFSISSLSDCSIGVNDRNAISRREKSKDRNKRIHRSFEKSYDDRGQKRSRKHSRDRNTDDYLKFEPNTANSYQSGFQGNNRHEVDQVVDPSICEFGASQMSHSEPSYIQPKNSSDENDGRLERLERMVELLVQNNKPQAGNVIPPKEMRPDPSGVPLSNTQFITSIWLNKVNEECLDRQFDEITCISFMQSKTTGLMKAWFKTIDPYVYTWPELKMLVIKTFPDNIDFASTLHMLVDRVKRPDETITQYYYSKMYLIEACKISGQNAVSCLIDGLNDSHLQKEAKEQSFLTPETLYSQFLMKIPHFGSLSHVLEEPVIEVVRDHEVRGREEYRAHEEFKKRDKKRNDSHTKCYTCGKFGHIAENCRHAPICYNCNRKGHIAAKCPNH